MEGDGRERRGEGRRGVEREGGREGRRKTKSGVVVRRAAGSTRARGRNGYAMPPENRQRSVGGTGGRLSVTINKKFNGSKRSRSRRRRRPLERS